MYRGPTVSDKEIKKHRQKHYQNLAKGKKNVWIPDVEPPSKNYDLFEEKP